MALCSLLLMGAVLFLGAPAFSATLQNIAGEKSSTISFPMPIDLVKVLGEWAKIALSQLNRANITSVRVASDGITTDRLLRGLLDQYPPRSIAVLGTSYLLTTALFGR
jgi:hypothetical protein